MIAVVVCSILLLAAIAGLVYVCCWPKERHEPQHAQHPMIQVRPTGSYANPNDAGSREYLEQLAGAEQNRRHSTMPRGADPLDDLPQIPTPPVPSWAAHREPDIDVTQSIPHAVGTWGKTAATLADQLADQHLAVKR